MGQEVGPILFQYAVFIYLSLNPHKKQLSQTGNRNMDFSVQRQQQQQQYCFYKPLFARFILDRVHSNLLACVPFLREFIPPTDPPTHTCAAHTDIKHECACSVIPEFITLYTVPITEIISRIVLHLISSVSSDSLI